MAELNVYLLKLRTSNWRSVEQAIYRSNHKCKTIDIRELSDLKNGSILVIPGVGNINDLHKEMSRHQPISTIGSNLRAKGIKVLGICLGFQFLCRVSEEYEQANCFRFFDCPVVSIHQPSRPSVGWKKLKQISNPDIESPLAKFLHEKSFYFTHSFGVKYPSSLVPEAEKYTYEVNDSDKIIAALINSNVIGFQFHPEKSGNDGINLISASLNYLQVGK